MAGWREESRTKIEKEMNRKVVEDRAGYIFLAPYRGEQEPWPLDKPRSLSRCAILWGQIHQPDTPPFLSPIRVLIFLL